MSQNGHHTPQTVAEGARMLSAGHKSADAALVDIYWFPDPDNKEIRLLEITPETLETGSVDAFAFRPTKGIPFYVVIAEITPDEWRQVEKGGIPLPDGWQLDQRQRMP